MTGKKRETHHSLLFFELGSVSFKASLVPKDAGNRITDTEDFPTKKLKNLLGLRMYRKEPLSSEILLEARSWFEEIQKWAVEPSAPADEVVVVATAVFRDMELFEYLDDLIWEFFGCRIHVLDGMLEAQLVISGYKPKLKEDVSMTLFDLGGGSLEVFCLQRHSTHFTSLALGAGRVTAWIMDGIPLPDIRGRIREEFSRKCQTIKDLSPRLWHGTGGAVRSFLKHIVRKQTHEPIWHFEIGEELDRIIPLVFERRTYLRREVIADNFHGLKEAAPQNLAEHRRKIYLGGLLILGGFCRHFGVKTIKLDSASVRSGALKLLQLLRPATFKTVEGAANAAGGSPIEDLFESTCVAPRLTSLI